MGVGRWRVVGASVVWVKMGVMSVGVPLMGMFWVAMGVLVVRVRYHWIVPPTAMPKKVPMMMLPFARTASRRAIKAAVVIVVVCVILVSLWVQMSCGVAG